MGDAYKRAILPRNSCQWMPIESEIYRTDIGVPVWILGQTFVLQRPLFSVDTLRYGEREREDKCHNKLPGL